MRISAIKPYSYKNVATQNNNCRVNNTTSSTLQHQYGLTFNPAYVIPFKSSTHNWAYSKIGGYDEQLKQIQRILIDPIKDPTAAAAPIIIIYSPDKEVAQLVKQSIEDKLPSSVKKMTPDNITSFPSTINNGLLNGRRMFKYFNQKSIIMIDNIEQYINSTEKEIKKLKKDFQDVFTENDYENIRKYGNNSANIDFLKSVADYCSQIPKRDTDISSATTIFSVSDNPQIINPELLRRVGKVHTIVFPPLYGDAFAKILKNEVTKQNDFLRNIKNLPSKEIEKIDMPYKSWKNLQEIKNSSKENPLNLKPDKIAFDVIADFCSPDNIYGAFMAKQIPEIVQQATYKYIENPEKEFRTYLIMELKNTKRLMTPEEMEQAEKVKNYVEFIEDKEYFKDPEQVDKMLKLYNGGLLSKKKTQNLVSDIVNSEIESIKNQEEIDDTYANLKFKSTLDKLKSKYIISRIDQLSENRYKFSYQDGKTDYVDLYLGSFGWEKETLWIDSSDMKKVEITRHFINEIKSLDEFRKVKTIEFPTDEKPENELYKPTGRITIDKKPIYYINLEEINESK